MSSSNQQFQLSLYHFQACPFCASTRTTITGLAVDVELRDIVNQRQYRDELIQGGGKPQVPCLKIEQNGQTRWLYESRDIVAYLRDSSQAQKKSA